MKMKSRIVPSYRHENNDDILNQDPDHVNYFDQDFSDQEDHFTYSRNDCYPSKRRREASESSEDKG